MNFFSVHTLHPYILLVGLALFPRITMLFVGGPFSFLAWLGWAFLPHFTVAFIATQHYWVTNPELCIVAWIFALTGTSAEVKTSKKATVRTK